MSALTHDERVLALLSDGEPHTSGEVYDLRVVAHSRVSSLRRKGHLIDCWRDSDTYWYQLNGALTERGGRQADGSGLVWASEVGVSSRLAVPRSHAHVPRSVSASSASVPGVLDEQRVSPDSHGPADPPGPGRAVLLAEHAQLVLA